MQGLQRVSKRLSCLVSVDTFVRWFCVHVLCLNRCTYHCVRFSFYNHCELDEILSSFGSSLISISSFVVCCGKFKEIVDLLCLRMAWSYARAASLAVVYVPRPLVVPFMLICAPYLPDGVSLTPRNPVDETLRFFFPFGSLLRLCFMAGKFNREIGRRCL